MSTSSQKRYNLPGYGYVSYQLYAHAECVYDLLDFYGHIDRLQNTNQLGCLRNVFEGAHHTRWEYVISQLAIITELCSLPGSKDIKPGLGSSTKSWGTIEDRGLKDGEEGPSSGDLLQVLVLLSNIGHLPGTFATERAFLHKLRENNHFRNSFKSGIAGPLRQKFEGVLKEFEVYKINYYISSFFVERLRSKEESEDTVDLCQNVLVAYLNCTGKDESQFSEHAKLFEGIRRLAYLSLDSLYTPVPFSLDLTSIFLSLETYLKDVFSHGSVFQGAMIGLEQVMRDSVYLAPSSLIHLAEVSNVFVEGFEKEEVKVDTIGKVKKTFGPSEKWGGEFFDSILDKSVISAPKRTAKITFESTSDQPIDIIEDTVAWERESDRAVGITSCKFAAGRNPNRNHLVIAARCYKAEAVKAFNVARRLTGKLMEADSTSLVDSQKWVNSQRIMRFLMNALFGIKNEYRFETILPVPLASEGQELVPVFIGDGATNASNEIERYYKVAEDYFESQHNDHSESILNEIKALQQVMSEFSHRGRILSYWGSSYVVEPGGNRRAEFDGIALVLATNPSSCKALIVEAKNTSGNNSDAQDQLEKRLSELGITSDKYETNDISNIGVCACISVGDL